MQEVVYENPYGTSFLEVCAISHTVWFNNHQKQRYEQAGTGKGFSVSRSEGASSGVIIVKLSDV